MAMNLNTDTWSQDLEIVKEKLIKHINEREKEAGPADIKKCTDVARSVKDFSLPEQGRSMGELLDHVLGPCLRETMQGTHSGALGYVPGGGLPTAGFGDLVADVVNVYTGTFVPGPGLTQLENNVVQWFCQMVGYGDESGGILLSGGSMSMLSMFLAARTNQFGVEFMKNDGFKNAVIYTTCQTHHSIIKAALLSGILSSNIRIVGICSNYSMDVSSLRDKIAEDLRLGLIPFVVVASAGTTNTGSVDDFNSICDVAKKTNIWVHVDGCYGGFFTLTERGKKTLAGLERVDSVSLDPHKSLFLPYGTGALLVRSRAVLRNAFCIGNPTYMDLSTQEEDTQYLCFDTISPELTRPYRGLRVWLSLCYYGVSSFRAALNEKLDLAIWAHDQISKIPGVVIVQSPMLSLFAFRIYIEGKSNDELDKLNEMFLSMINNKRRVLLSSCCIPDRTETKPIFVLRCCILSFRTHLPQIQDFVDDVRECATKLLS